MSTVAKFPQAQAQQGLSEGSVSICVCECDMLMEEQHCKATQRAWYEKRKTNKQTQNKQREGNEKTNKKTVNVPNWFFKLFFFVLNTLVH